MNDLASQLGITLAAAVIGALGAYLGLRRTTRGTVQTSQASDLWAEANEIRTWLTNEVSTNRSEVAALRAKDEQQELRLQQQGVAISTLTQQAHDCEMREVALREEVKRLGGNA